MEGRAEKAQERNEREWTKITFLFSNNKIQTKMKQKRFFKFFETGTKKHRFLDSHVLS
mgnify:FL=1